MIDLAEKVRMALAEAGYPNADVLSNGGVEFRVPPATAWRAWQVVGVRSDCLACVERWPNGRKDVCLARGLGQGDCGADRSDP